MKNEHVTLATVITMLVLTATVVSFYYNQANAFTTNIQAVNARIDLVEANYKNNDFVQQGEIMKYAEAIAVLNNNMIRICNKVGADCQTVKP